MGNESFPQEASQLTAEQYQQMQDVYADVIETYKDQEVTINGHTFQFGLALAMREAMCPVESDVLQDTKFALGALREAGQQLRPEHADFLARLTPKSWMDK